MTVEATPSPDIANPDAASYIARFSSPTPSGDYAVDCNLGRQLADELASDMGEAEFYSYLPFIVRDIAQRGQFGAVQIGFFSRIGQLASR